MESRSRDGRERLISGREKERFRQTLRSVASDWPILPLVFPLPHPNRMHT